MVGDELQGLDLVAFRIELIIHHPKDKSMSLGPDGQVHGKFLFRAGDPIQRRPFLRQLVHPTRQLCLGLISIFTR